MSGFLRWWHLDRETVDHFDEGVYSSVLWYEGQTERRILPGSIMLLRSSVLHRLSSWIPGFGERAPRCPHGVWFSDSACFLACGSTLFAFPPGFLALRFAAVRVSHSVFTNGDDGRSGFVLDSCRLLPLGGGRFGPLNKAGHFSQALPVESRGGSSTQAGCRWQFCWSGSIVWWIWVGRRSASIGNVLKTLAIVTATSLFVFGSVVVATSKRWRIFGD